MSYKEDVLKQLDDGFAGFKETLAGLTDDEMTRAWYGEWSAKDILAHVAGWHREMSGALERLGRGERPTPEGVDYSDSDTWNARFASARASTPPPEMLAELDASFRAFRSAADALPEERFEQGRTVDRILHTTGINHYDEHGPPIRTWRATL